MKTHFQFLLILAVCVSFVACQSKADNKSSNSNTTQPTAPSNPTIDFSENLLPRDSAIAWIKRWEEDAPIFMATDTITYFDMPLVDLQDIVADTTVKEARYYLGLEDKGTALGLIAHLILVGLDSDNKPNFNKAYDYTTVCPPACDVVEN